MTFDLETAQKNYKKAQRKQFLKFIAIVFGFLFLLVIGIDQGSKWGKYFFEGPFLRTKLMFGLADKADARRLLVICNTIDRTACSIAATKKLLSWNPDDRTAQANLAAALAKDQKFCEAIPIFEKLVLRGVAAYDVFYWYAKSLRNCGKSDEAVSWYYNSLEVYPGFLNTSEELADLLVDQGSTEEAIGMLSSLNNRIPSIEPYIRAKLVLLKKAKASPSAELSKIIRTPAFDDSHFYLPVRILESDSAQVFMVDTGASGVALSPELLAEMGGEIPTSAKKVQIQLAQGKTWGREIFLKSLSIGPFTIQNVRAIVCEKCAPLLGMSALSRFSIRTVRNGGINFLELKK